MGRPIKYNKRNVVRVKIQTSDILEIKNLYKQGKSLLEISSKYNVHKDTIRYYLEEINKK